MTCIIVRAPAPFIISPPREETVLVPAPDLLQRQGRGFRWLTFEVFTSFNCFNLGSSLGLPPFANIALYTQPCCQPSDPLPKTTRNTKVLSSPLFSHAHGSPILRGLVEKTIVRPFSPGGSVQFSFLLWVPISIGQARYLDDGAAKVL